MRPSLIPPRFNLPVSSLLVVLRVTPVLLAVRSLLTPTVAGVHTVVVPSQARTTPRSTVPLPTSVAGSPSLWSRQASPVVRLSSSHTPLVSPSQLPSLSRPTVPLTSLPMSSLRLSRRTLTCVQVSLSRSSTSSSQSTAPPPRTVTSPTRTSPGRSQRRSSSRCLVHLLEVYASTFLFLISI